MLEKDDSWDIVEYGEADTSSIKDALVNMISGEDDFANDNKNTEVEPNGARVHLIYDFPLDWDGEDVTATVVSENKELIDSAENLISHLEDFYNGRRARVLVAKLGPKMNLERREDTSEYLLTVRRNHIPIITNDKVYFGTGRTEVSMKQSFWYEINNSKSSWVKNDSDLDRYHLLIDIMPNDKINK